MPDLKSVVAAPEIDSVAAMPELDLVAADARADSGVWAVFGADSAF